MSYVQRGEAKPDPISIGTVDVAAVFNQTTENPAHSLFTATQVKVETSPDLWE